MALDITRLSGGNTPADGSDPRTFPAIWNSTATALEGLELDDLTGVTVTSPTTGQILEYDGSDWVNVDADAPGDNLLYNGAMQVAQRGTSATTLGNGDSGYHTADRWALAETGTPTFEFTQTVEADAPTGSGFANSLKMEVTTADASLGNDEILRIEQKLEGQDLQGLKKGTSSAESLTLSFWVKSDEIGTYIVEFADIDNSRTISRAYSILSADTWEKKILTIPGDTIGSLDNDGSQSLAIRFMLLAGTDYTSGTLATSWVSTVNADRYVGQTNLAAATSNYWQITGVQLEVGPVATPFEFKAFGQELLECQRYYYKTVLGDVNRRIATGYASSTTVGRVMTPFPVSMRVSPTALEQTGTASDYGLLYLTSGAACSSVPTFLDATTEAGFSSFTVSAVLTAGIGVFGYLVTGTNSFLAWSAEL